MRRYIILLVLVLGLTAMLAQINGNLDQIGDKKIMHLWGTHYERGFAHGYLLAEQIKDVFHNYYFVMQSLSSPTLHAANLLHMNTIFAPDNRFVTECSGIVQGMAASQVGSYYEPLQRNLGTEDILMLNIALDLSYLLPGEFQHGCATLSSWGISTQADESLAGAAVITRFLDWTPNSSLIANPVLIVHHPSEPDEQKWMNFGFPGMIGAISAISETGTAAFMNTGNDHYYTITENLFPILFTIRSGLEKADWDGNELHDAEDLYYSINNSRPLAGFIVPTLTERDGYFYAGVFETNNGGTARRLYNQNGDLPARHLAATNHFRVLSYPTCCTRYTNIQDSLYTNPAMTAKRQWQVLAGAAGMDNNLMAIQYIPSQNYLLWSTAEGQQPAYTRPGLTLDLQQLFSSPLGNNQDTQSPGLQDLRIFPNPTPSIRQLRLESSLQLVRADLYNSRGQLMQSGGIGSNQGLESWMDQPDLPNGIYFLRLQDTDLRVYTKRFLLVR